MTKSQLELMRTTSQFTCPQCGNPLRLKIGKVVTPHFAHIVLSDCFTSFSERESQTHLTGKQQLAEFFTRVGFQVEVEAFIPKISQRPDLLVKKGRNLYAVEFQCSVIPIDDVSKRSLGYSQVKIPSIWLLRTPANINVKATGVTFIKLSKFDQSFITVDSSDKPTLMTYDPTSTQFVYISHLLHINGSSFIAKICTLPNMMQNFPFAHIKPLTQTEANQYWSIYQHKRSKFLTNRINSSKFGTRDKFLNNCYVERILPKDLPIYIGFPLPGTQVFQNHSTEWQLALICALSQKQIDFDNISEEWIETFLAEYCRVIDFKIAKNVVMQYCQFLQEINFDLSKLVSQQIMEETYLKQLFHKLLVAKR